MSVIRVVLPIRRMIGPGDDEAMDPDRGQNRTHAVRSSLIGLAAIVVAYALILAVLSDPDMAHKLTYGVPPPGTAVIRNQIAVIAAVLAALGGWAAVIATRRAIPMLLMLLPTVPFVPIALFTFVVAF